MLAFIPPLKRRRDFPLASVKYAEGAKSFMEITRKKLDEDDKDLLWMTVVAPVVSMLWVRSQPPVTFVVPAALI